MEYILISSFSTAIVMIGIFMYLMKSSNDQIRRIDEDLQKLSDKTLGVWSKEWDQEPPTVPYRISKVYNTIEGLSRSLLPLIQPDIDMVLKLNYAGYMFKELETRRDGVVVVMERSDGTRHSQPLVNILDRAAGLKALKDQLCPTKCTTKKPSKRTKQ